MKLELNATIIEDDAEGRTVTLWYSLGGDGSGVVFGRLVRDGEDDVTAILRTVEELHSDSYDDVDAEISDLRDEFNRHSHGGPQ